MADLVYPPVIGAIKVFWKYLGLKFDFEGVEKVKICLSLDDNTHPIQKVREFVNTSPAQGWTVTFSGENYTNATMICNSAGSWCEVYIYCMMNSDGYMQVVYDKI